MDEEHRPWKRQRILKKEDIPTQQQVYNMALALETPRDITLFIVSYLTAGRVSEIVRQPKLRKNEYQTEEFIDNKGQRRVRVVRNSNGSPSIKSVERIPLNYKGITKNNITFEERGGKPLIIISMQNRKNKQFKRKNIPIPVSRENKLIKLMRYYLALLDETQPLFNFGVGNAERIIGKVGMNPHFLRDIRLTHMVTLYNFNSFELAKFAGWKNSAPAERYVRLGYSDLVSKY